MSNEIPEGWAFVPGRSRAQARALLAAAETAGEHYSVVRTQSEGYLVPQTVIDHYEAPGGAEPVETPAQVDDGPNADWKNDDIKAYAAEHEIDLGSATTKADMLAAIAEAQKE